jgi:hypothetical protein
MKKLSVMMILICTILVSCTTNGKTQKEGKQTATLLEMTNLNTAVEEFSVYIAERLPSNTLTAVAISDTPVQRLGNYIADELSNSLLNNNGLRMVSRRDFDRILAEQNLQASGNVDDKTAARIGHNFGWRTIIYATVEPLDEAYRLAFRAIDGYISSESFFVLSYNILL